MPRTSVGKSSVSKAAEHDCGAAGGDDRERRREPQNRAVPEEERHLEDGRHDQSDDRDRPAAAGLGELAGDDDARTGRESRR